MTIMETLQDINVIDKDNRKWIMTRLRIDNSSKSNTRMHDGAKTATSAAAAAAGDGQLAQVKEITINIMMPL